MGSLDSDGFEPEETTHGINEFLNNNDGHFCHIRNGDTKPSIFYGLNGKRVRIPKPEKRIDIHSEIAEMFARFSGENIDLDDGYNIIDPLIDKPYSEA